MAHRTGWFRALSAWRGWFAPALAGALLVAASGVAVGASDVYTIAGGDVLDVSVFDHPDLTTVAHVSNDGQIRFPLIGSVYVGGLTVARVADVLTARLAAGYLVDPQVTVSIREYRVRKVSVIGKVNRPGVYEFRGRLTFLELLSRAGGLAPDAGTRAVLNRRGAPPGAAPVEIDLRRLLVDGSTELDVELADGDTVAVLEAGSFTLTGEVRRPGEYQYEEGMTLLRAVALAGGFTDQAAPERTRIVHAGGEAAGASLPAGGAGALSARIEAGDIVTVPAAGVYYLTGEVRRPGEYRYEEGMTLLRAVTLAGGYTERADGEHVRIIRVTEGREKMLDPAGTAAAPDTALHPGDIVVVNVARAEVCYVSGEVKNAGAYRCDSETTVMKAVTLAGGFTDAAARGRIRIIRRVEGREQVLERVGLEENVLPDDVLVVPKSFF